MGIKISELDLVTSVDPTTAFVPVVLDGRDRKIRLSSAPQMLSGILPILGGKPVSINSIASTATGDVDVYTVPTGYKFHVVSAIAQNGTTGTLSHNFKWTAYISGAYRSLSTLTTSLGAGSSNTMSNIILEAGEKLAINRSATGLKLLVKGILFSDSVPAYSPRITSVGLTNTLYTAPSGVTAVGFGTNYPVIFNVSNYTGSSRSYQFYVIPNGGSATSATAITTSTSVSTSNATSTSSSHWLAAGDSLYFTSSSTASGQFAWTTVYEHST